MPGLEGKVGMSRDVQLVGRIVLCIHDKHKVSARIVDPRIMRTYTRRMATYTYAE